MTAAAKARLTAIIVAAQPQVGEGAGGDADDDQVPDERAVLQRSFRKVDRPHRPPASSSRTVWPGRSVCTPAVTTMSPAATPPSRKTRSAL